MAHFFSKKTTLTSYILTDNTKGGGWMDMTEFFSHLGTTGMPWYGVVASVILSAGASFFAARSTSKGHSQDTLITQTVERQKQLDERQSRMMDDLADEVKRFRDEMLQIRKELDSERNKAIGLQTKVTSLTKKVQNLTDENNQLKAQVQSLQEENRVLRENINGTHTTP